MRIKKLSSALAISVVFHIIIPIIAGFHLGTQDLHFKDLVAAEMVLLPKSPKPKVRRSAAKPVVKPIVPTRNTFVMERPRHGSRTTPAFVAESNSAPQARMLSAPSSSHITTVVEQSQTILRGPEMSSARRAPGILPLSQVGASRPPQIVLNPPNGAAYDDVFFKGSGTNPFIDTEDDAFSTFGMDVDTASYAVMRRFLRDGRLPPLEAVRVEEFVNAFDYNYTPPANEAFAIHLEGAPSKFGEGKRLQLLRIGVQGRIIPDTDRKDAILTFVIDVSGSMRMENRLELVKRALTLLLEQLRPSDKVGIVVYGTDARVVLPHTGIVNREHILTAIHALAPEAATNAAAGLRAGYKLALQNSKPNCINRVILCSDGVANVGQTGSEAILKEIRTYVKEGVTLTTVGFGMGNYNDILMEELANNGNGSYAYVDTLNEAKRIFVENLTGTLQVIAKDAKIQVEFNPETVSRFRLLGYENRRLAHEDFRNDTVDAGEVGAGHSVTALYEIKLHENADGKLATVSIRHENPDTGNVTEVNRSISTDALKGSFEGTTSAFQLAACVAEFAEILRGSFWAREGSLEIVRETLEGVLTKTQEYSARNEELLSLVHKAHRFKEHEKEG